MSACCHDPACAAPDAAAAPGSRYRKVLWAALLVNAFMFAVEIGAGMRSGSVSLLADAIDFAGDAANYGITLMVLSMGLPWRGRAAVVKALSMGGFGLFVLGRAAWAVWHGAPPEPMVMGVVALLALAANGGVAALLYAFREGDANMRSVWLCSRNDALGNLAVLAAALGVFGTGTAWPDLAVAGIMAGLSLGACVAVLRQAKREAQSVRLDGISARNKQSQRPASAGT
jgi:Co/Zn/Cd efflux system component